MTAQIVAGIDVGKQWLDGVVLPSGEYRRMENRQQGWQEIVAWLGSEGVDLIVLEASGGYERGIVGALAGAGLTVSVGNPLLLRRFAQSQGIRAKTDRIDARMLARYAQQVQPKPTVLPSETQRTVAALLTRRRQLGQMRAEELTRLDQTAPALCALVVAHVDWLTIQLKQLDHQLAEQVKRDATLQLRVQQVTTTPGLAMLTATRLLVGLPELGYVPAKVANALVGVAPYAQDSGQLRGRRSICGGRRWVRHALYEAVMTTIRCDPTFRAFYDRLRAAGKPHKVAMVASIRRLLGILTAMLRDGLTWQETKVGQGQFLTVAV